ncbi:hypothetical protein [Spiroplasma sp. AdecLV25b]|uniref:hypothetical protein n=1 Tax=Spiroplasma sp. AdecLV25b TaxID=3027162 RepID=UPI0027E00764|nr:hypothetical protein [Spiroplasma sp. AdecLV25b]
MKQLTIILSSLTTLTLANNVTANVINNTTNINSELNNSPSNETKLNSLFNNKFGYLNQDSWITNKATTDSKYYSYDTNHAVGKLSDGTPTKNAFIVDSNGNLTIDSSLKLTDADKNMLNNIQQEMTAHKKVTTVKDSYNPYSKSVYSASFFSGDNSSWKYLQMGGVENRIDISSQQSANKVEHSNSLSETLGLYYIAKAERIPGGIDRVVAKSLGTYFLNQSSFKSPDEVLADSVINVIATNDNVYNINSSINYGWNNEYIGPSFGTNYDTSNTYTLINWSNNARDWDTFTKIYSTFNFNNNSYLKLTVPNHDSNINFESSKQTTDIQDSNNITSLYIIYLTDIGHFAEIDLRLWHDNTNIYFKWFLA